MYGWPSSDRLNSAGSLSIVMAVLYLPSLLLGILAEESGILVLRLVDLSLDLVLVTIQVVVYQILIALLNGPLYFRGLNLSLKLLVASSILEGIISVLDAFSVFDDHTQLLIALPWAFIVGLVCVIVGVELRIFWAVMPSLKAFSVTQIIFGILIMSLIFISLAPVAAVISDVFLAFVFWEAAERSSAGWFDPEADDPTVPAAAAEF